MSLPVVTVVIPTIDGRETDFQRCRLSYETCADGSYDLDLIVVRNEPTCGWGWQKGIEQMRADSEYLHLTCDDIEPQLGWAAAGIAAIKEHVLPAPRILHGYTDYPEMFPAWGNDWPENFSAGLSALPFMSRELFELHVAPMLTSHYFGDNWVTYRSAQAGFPALTRRGYFFRHHWSDVKRGAGMEYNARLEHDRLLYVQAVGMAERGEWTAPWPPREDSP